MVRPKLYKLIDWLIRRRARRREPGARRHGILLVSSGGLGDTILFSLITPRFLELAANGEPVDVLVQDGNTAVAFLFPPGTNVFSVDYRRFRHNSIYRYRISKGLQDRGYRIAVSTDHLRLPTVDDALVAACAAEQSLALEPRSWRKHDADLHRNLRFYTTVVKVQNGMVHRLVRWLELINAVTGRDDPPPLVSFPPERLPDPVRLPAPTVVLHPFSSEPERQFAAKTFAMIADTIPSDQDIVLSAGPGDLERNPEFRILLDRHQATLDEGPLLAKMALMRAARFVVSVDTSIMHLAVGAGVPTLCLCSAAHVVDSVPYDLRMTPENVTFLYHDMPCRGCLGTCIHPLEGGRVVCVASLSPREILDAVKCFV